MYATGSDAVVFIDEDGEIEYLDGELFNDLDVPDQEVELLLQEEVLVASPGNASGTAVGSLDPVIFILLCWFCVWFVFCNKFDWR